MRIQEYKGHKIALHTVKLDDDQYTDIYVDGKLIGETRHADQAYEKIDNYLANR